MVNSKVVQKALKRTLALENNPGIKTNKPSEDQSGIISRLIYDFFGGEILKTRMEKGWYFYNLIEGKRVDFTRSKIVRFSGSDDFTDIPSTPEFALRLAPEFRVRCSRYPPNRGQSLLQ